MMSGTTLVSIQLLICIFLPSPSVSKLFYDYETSTEVKTLGGGRNYSISRFNMSGKLTISTLWRTPGGDELLQKFQLNDVKLTSRINKRKPFNIGEEKFGQTFIADMTLPFYVVYENTTLTRNFFSPGTDQNQAVQNMLKGIIDMFQTKSYDWQGREISFGGTCFTKYSANEFGSHKVKLNCHPPFDAAYTNNDDENVLGAKIDSNFSGLYTFTKDEDFDVVESANITENIISQVNLHSELATVITTKQYLVLRESKDVNDITELKSLEEGIEVLKANDDSLREHTLLGQWSFSVSDKSLDKIISKNKKYLRTSSLATKEAVTTFHAMRNALSKSPIKKAQAAELLNSKKNRDLWPQLMDVFGSCRNPEVHYAIIDRFVTSKPDLIERYLWSVAQVKELPSSIALGLFQLAKKSPKIQSPNVMHTLVLTLGSISNHVQEKQVAIDILKWIWKKFQNCKHVDFDCQKLYIGALRNSQSEDYIQQLWTIVESSTDVNTVCEVLKALASFPLKHPSMDTSKLLAVFTDHKRDIKIRRIVAEILLDSKPSIDLLRQLISNLYYDYDPELSTYVMKRMIELSEKDVHIQQLVRKLVSNGSINWSNLALTGYSTPFRSQIFSTMEKCAYLSFSMEMAGMVFKQSNLMLYLEHVWSQHKYPLLQLDTFVGGMSQYIGNHESDDNSEPYAGMQLSVLNNQLRPFNLFSSTSELMDLYWSGRGEEKNPVLQGTISLQDDVQKLILANGMPVVVNINSAVSFDSSGSAKVSLWTKEANTIIENSIAYVLNHVCHLMLGPTYIINHQHNYETQMKLNVKSDVYFGSSGQQMCIKMEQPKFTVELNRKQGLSNIQRLESESSVKWTIHGRSYSLSQAIHGMCNKMYQKA